MSNGSPGRIKKKNVFPIHHTSTAKSSTMTSLTCRIYLTSNLLVGAFFTYLSLPLGTGGIMIDFATVIFSSLFSIPAGFALYYILLLVNSIRSNTLLRWTAFSILVFLVSLIPYLFVCGVLAGELNNRELQLFLWLSEGSAFGAVLLNGLAIHRFIKNSSHETN